MTAEQERHVAGARLGNCPICGKAAQHESRPFCSRRCADVDLARWLGGSYVIAAGSSDADEDGDDAAAGIGRAGGSQRPADNEE